MRYSTSIPARCSSRPEAPGPEPRVPVADVVHRLRIPFSRPAPAILLIATIGGGALCNLVADVRMTFIAGGCFLHRSGDSMAGIVPGIILGHE